MNQHPKYRLQEYDAHRTWRSVGGRRCDRFCVPPDRSHASLHGVVVVVMVLMSTGITAASFNAAHSARLGAADFSTGSALRA